MKTWAVEIQASGLSDADMAHQLRTGDPAVIGRLRAGKLVLDVRTIFPHQEAALAERVRGLFSVQPRT
jgi:hypothetical protein